MKIDWNTIKRKLTSRKFWAAVIGFAIAVGSALGADELSTESVTLIVSGCAALCAYILGEGIADASKSTTDK